MTEKNVIDFWKENARSKIFNFPTKDLEDAFNGELTFGTGGLRGIMGLGTNRLNEFVIARVTHALLKVLKSKNKHPKVLVGYDTRKNSKTFAKLIASIVYEEGGIAYFSKNPCPTPVTSFGIRYFKCDSGIMLTASHNAKEYNGYKVYNSKGSQITEDDANLIYKELKNCSYFEPKILWDFNKGVKEKKIKILDDNLYNPYLKSTIKTSIDSAKRSLNILYSPLCGTGYNFVKSALKMDGFKNVNLVKEQCVFDGEFSSCPYPNPEHIPTLKIGTKLLIQNSHDILVSTDPDSDRCGVVVNHRGVAKNLSGNEIGILLTNFLINIKEKNINKNSFVVKTIVTSDLIYKICEEKKVNVKDVLTGFKYIGEEINEAEEKNKLTDYLFGFEESCGYLTNTDIRDKDGVNAVLLICEMANYYKNKGSDLYEEIQKIYEKFGNFKSNLFNVNFEGLNSNEKTRKIMDYFRSSKSNKLFKGLVSKYDFLNQTWEGEKVIKIGKLPKSDVIKLFFKNGDTFTIRPSGTEPKIKFYSYYNSDENLNDFGTIVNQIKKDF